MNEDTPSKSGDIPREVDDESFVTEFNKVIEDTYSDEEMSDLQVPEIMDINDATLEGDTLTLYCTVQYEDGEREDCTFAIQGFTGESGTYELVAKDDAVLDVDSGNISIDTEVVEESIKFSNIQYDINVVGMKRNGMLTESFIINKVNK